MSRTHELLVPSSVAVSTGPGASWLTRALGVALLITCFPSASAAPGQPRLGTLQGEVQRGGSPAAYANITVAGTSLCTQADSLGRFVLANVPTGARELIVTRFGNSPTLIPVLVHAGLSPRQWYMLGGGPDPASDAAREEAARDSSGGVIEGSVTEASGGVCPFANVIVLGTRRGDMAGEDGLFRITRVPPGRWLVRIQFIGREPGSDTVDVAAGKVTHVNLHPGHGGRLAAETLEVGRGSNPWADTTYVGYPIFPGTYVLPRLEGRCDQSEDTLDASPFPQRRIVSDASGRFELRVIPGTSGFLRIAYSLRPGVHFKTLRIVDDEGVVAKDFHLAGDDEPNGVVVWNRDYGTRTLAPPGCYRVVSETGAGMAEIPFALRWSRVRLDSIPDHAVVEGVVVDSSGRAVVGARVQVGMPQVQALTDSSGHFELACVPPGELFVRAWSMEPPALLGGSHVTVAARSRQSLRLVVPGKVPDP